MGIAERREREKEQRRKDIVDAAEKVFFSQGWQNATMDDVAEAAELSKATLYLYFKNKEDLYAAILVRGSEILLRAFQDAVGQHDTGLEQVAAVGRAYIAFHDSHAEYYDAMMYFDAKGFDASGDCEFAQKCDDYRDRIMGLVANAVRNGVEDGTLRADLDPAKTAVLLWAQSSGVLQVLAVGSEKLKKVYGVNPSDLIETFFDFCFFAIAAHPDEAISRAQRNKNREKVNE
jgi:AcrR family transcriptional regulator